MEQTPAMRRATGSLIAILACGLPLLAAVPPALAQGGGRAQDRPPMVPTRDISVTYRAEGGGAPGETAEMRLSWLNSEQKMRMDLPGGIGWSVTDMRSGQAFMVNDA